MMANILEVLLDYKRLLKYALPALLLVGSLAFRIGMKKSGELKTFTEAHQMLTKIELMTPEKVNPLLKRHPELSALLGNVYAQKLIAEKNTLAKSFYEKGLKRIEGFQSSFQEYSEGSILINDEEFDEALKRSIGLKNRMDEEENLNLLYGFNLVRIASLYEKIGDAEEERAAWEAVREFAKSEVHMREAQGLLGAFQEQNVTLLDYIDYRLAAIGS